MNTQPSEQHILTILEQQKDIKPSEELLHATLRKLPRPSVLKSPYLSFVRKFSVVAMAILVVAAGGALYAFHYQPTHTNSAAVSLTPGSSTSALNSDLNTIDAQLAGLSTDTAAADQALYKSEKYQ